MRIQIILTFLVQDVLEFKEKRTDELKRVRHEIEEFYQRIINTRDPERALFISKNEIEDACIDLIRVAKKRRLRSVLGSLKPTFNLTLDKGIIGAAGAAGLDGMWQLGMPGVSAVAGAALAGLTVSLQTGGVDIRPRNSPYAYVTSYHKELFIV